jgi:SpoIIAA-like
VITELSGLPEGVIGFEASGKLAAEDYRDVVLPAVERVAKTGDVRFLIIMRDFDGMTGGALWQDLKTGIEHLRAWKRVALVTDIGWMSHATDLFGWMTPGETKTFALDQQGQAIRWLTSSPGDR